MVRNLKTGAVSEVACGGIFMAIGHVPNTALFKGQLETDENGYLLTHDGTTRHERARASSRRATWPDHRYRQAVTAAGSGCMAAIDAERFLSH